MTPLHRSPRRARRARPASLALVMLAAALPAPAAAQAILVAPPGVFIDHRIRSGAIELYNPGTTPSEVSISAVYGFPVTDSLGRTSLQIVEQPDSTQPSAARWIDAYPRRLVIQGRDRQTVRLLARPPADLPDGEYWTRLVISARAGAVPVATEGDTSVKVGVTLQVNTVIAVLYRKGAVQTGISAADWRARATHDSLHVRVRLDRAGNAAFIGALHAALVDSAGREVARHSAPLAVYRPMEPAFSVPLAGVAPGRYRLRLTIDTERTDVRRDALLAVTPIEHTLDLTVPPAS